ncbi:hypothetical protein BKA57DRAFT_447873 [Linnemannia elongata]|nr:hypothetical protein BKA57DRAFT_447873 [Linnemannia elongata]
MFIVTRCQWVSTILPIDDSMMAFSFLLFSLGIAKVIIDLLLFVRTPTNRMCCGLAWHDMNTAPLRSLFLVLLFNCTISFFVYSSYSVRSFVFSGLAIEYNQY